MKHFVIIVAGGKGLRMGGELPKQFIPINGKPILMHTLEKFHRWNAQATIVLALPVDHQDYWQMLCREIGCKVPHQVVNGGETRFHSVKNALEFLRPEITGPADCVAIHDGVRPFVSEEVIDSCFQLAHKEGAVIPVMPSVDSLCRVEQGKSYAVDRSLYACVQTPQVFCGQRILEAYDTPYKTTFTDDASVAESIGMPIYTVAGNRENIKITTSLDLLVAQALFQQEIENR